MGIQDVGVDFNLTKLFEAREVARALTYELSSLIRPGMTEDEAHRIYKDLSLKHRVEKQWHPPKLRMGPNSVKSFREVSEPYVLQEEDIYFVDIGPVIFGHEADYGETFAVGNKFEHKHIINTSKKVFDEVAGHWKKHRMSGAPLYDYAKSRAEHYGYDLNLGSNGHRIGDFPHHVHFKGDMVDCEEVIVPNAWILEIHLWDKKKAFGAFFEDILTDETTEPSFL